MNTADRLRPIAEDWGQAGSVTARTNPPVRRQFLFVQTERQRVQQEYAELLARIQAMLVHSRRRA